MTGAMCASDGCRIAYRLDGQPDGPVIMLSNSLGTCFEMWNAQVARLTARYRVLRYDSRGHGRSESPDAEYSIERLGRDALELLDEIGVGRAHFCGLSLGGMVGMWLAANEGERIDRLILCNTAAQLGPPAAWLERAAAVRAGGMAAVADAVLERWFTSDFRRARPDEVERIRSMLLTTDPTGYAGCCAAIRDMDLREALSLITRPTLVVAGAQDPATPREAAIAIAAAIAGSRLAVLDAAHLSNVEAAEPFTGAVTEFLGDQR